MILFGWALQKIGRLEVENKSQARQLETTSGEQQLQAMQAMMEKITAGPTSGRGGR